jgi:hypothetical protein
LIGESFLNLFGQQHLNDGILVGDLFFLWLKDLLKSCVLAFYYISFKDLVLEFETGTGLQRCLYLARLEGFCQERDLLAQLADFSLVLDDCLWAGCMNDSFSLNLARRSIALKG